MAAITKSPHQVHVPVTDAASYVFSTGTASSREAPQYFDAAFPAKCFSLSQAEIFVKQFARGLEVLGLQPDDKVLLYSHNRLFFPVLLWGVLAARCVFTAASPGASAKELEYQVRNSEAKLVIAGPDQVSVALEAAARVGLRRDQVYLFCDLEEDLSQRSSQLHLWTDIWRPAAEIQSWSWRKINNLEEAQQTTAIINYSSGTTGLPKGVEISHYNVVANSIQVVFKRGLMSNDQEGRSRKERMDMSGERWLAPLPMYHTYGQAYYCFNGPRLGAKIFVMKSFDVQKYLLYLDIYRINYMVSVPAILATLAKQPNPGRYNLKAIETVVSGSAPLNPDLGRLIEKLYLRPGVQVKMGWGLTETTCSVTGFAPDDTGDDGRSIGWLNPNCAARIEPIPDRDFNGTVRAGTLVGEIWVAGPNVMKGYYKNPTGTAETIVESDGYRWLRTGDIGYIDDKGRIYIVDRLKELIKVKGLQVAPLELEQYLLTHPDVADAAVIGAKINGGEYPRAFVVREKGVVTERELADMIKANFAAHKWLTGGVYFIKAIPRTGSGKVMRRELSMLEPKSNVPRARL